MSWTLKSNPKPGPLFQAFLDCAVGAKPATSDRGYSGERSQSDLIGKESRLRNS
jgi:hypothetical protein